MDIDTTQKISFTQRFHLKWLLPLFLRPKKTTALISEQEKRTWLSPLLILSIFVILYVVISGPLRREQILMNATTPPDFEYYSPEMQDQYFQAQAKQTSFAMIYLLPMLTGVLKYWISWFILGSLLHLSLTLAGSRAPSVKSMNLAAWSFMPFVVRILVQILAALFARSLVTHPGLSGFLPSDVGGMTAYARSFLGMIDIYLFFQVILLLLGSQPLSGLAKTKAWVATLIPVIILLLLMAVPGWVSSMLSGLSSSGGFFYF